MAPALQATLTQGSVSRHLRSMAVPMVWGLLATMSFNAVDTLFVAQLGDDQLAAMSFTFPVVMVLTSIAIGLGAGTSSAVSRAVGSGDQHKARRMATDAISLTTIISITVSTIGWFTIEPLFRLLGATSELLPLVRDYMGIWYFSAPFLMVPQVSLAAFRAMGMSHVQGYLMGGAAILNLVLDPLLIFGLWGFPRLELQGAALATLFTRAITLVVAFYVLHVRLHMLVNPLVGLQKVKESWKGIVHVGIPAMVTNVIIPLSSGVVVALVAKYGTAAVAGLGIALRIEPLALIVFYALSGVVGPFCGQNLGAGKYERLQELQRVITRFCLAFGLILAFVLLWAGKHLSALFSDSPEVLPIAVSYLSLVPISYGAYGLVMSVNAAFNGLGLPNPAMMISFLRVLGIYLPLAWLSQSLWGLTGLFVATAAANAVIGVVAYFWLQQRIGAMTQAVFDSR